MDKRTNGQKDIWTKGQKDNKTKRTIRYCDSGVISHKICNHEIL